MNATGVSRRSCDDECALYNSKFEITAFFRQEEGGAVSCKPIQRAVACGVNEKMVRARMAVTGLRSAMRFCVAEDATSMEMPANTL